MTTTADRIERPEWATKTDYLDGAEGQPECHWHERELLATQSFEGVENVGSGWVDGEARFVLTQNAAVDGGGVFMSDPLGLDFGDVAALRRYALTLLSAADEWESLTGGTR